MATKRGRSREDAGTVQELLDAILTDALGEDEQLWAFREAFEERVHLPEDAFVIGEPVSVVAIDYGGNVRRGLTATCVRRDGSEHVVSVCDVLFPEGSSGALHVAAYRLWTGIDLVPPGRKPARPRPARRHKAAEADLDLSRPISLIALSIKEPAIRCRIPESGREITLRARAVALLVPGQILTVRGSKYWTYAGHPYLSGTIESHRIDVPALGLEPLGLTEMGLWDPADHYWGEEDEPLEEWARPIFERGPWPVYEMEQVLPGENLDDAFDDPILEANDLGAAGDPMGARAILMKLLAEDLRCLDAHAHLGNSAFKFVPEEAILHYEIGLRIGELSLGEEFDGLLPWGQIDNRPFMRCLHGYGICLWRLGQRDQAVAVFERMLWLNPTDNQGARFLLSEVREGEDWVENYGDR